MCPSSGRPSSTLAWDRPRASRPSWTTAIDAFRPSMRRQAGKRPRSRRSFTTSSLRRPSRRFELGDIESRSLSTIATKRELVLAGLFAPDLGAWELTRADLIETPKSTYDQTVLWAKAIHHARTDIHGLVWTSRRCDPERSAMFFGDRVTATDFDEVERLDVSADPRLLVELRGFGRRAGITIIS